MVRRWDDESLGGEATRHDDDGKLASFCPAPASPLVTPGACNSGGATFLGGMHGSPWRIAPRSLTYKSATLLLTCQVSLPCTLLALPPLDIVVALECTP